MLLSTPQKTRKDNNQQQKHQAIGKNTSVACHLRCWFVSPAADNIATPLHEGRCCHTGSLVTSAKVDARNTTVSDSLGFICARTNQKSSLTNGTTYVLTMQTFGCDGWYDDTGTKISVMGGVAADVTSVYGTPPAILPGGGGKDHCYGPLNFYFSWKLLNHNYGQLITLFYLSSMY